MARLEDGQHHARPGVLQQSLALVGQAPAAAGVGADQALGLGQLLGVPDLTVEQVSVLTCAEGRCGLPHLGAGADFRSHPVVEVLGTGLAAGGTQAADQWQQQLALAGQGRGPLRLLLGLAGFDATPALAQSFFGGRGDHLSPMGWWSGTAWPELRDNVPRRHTFSAVRKDRS